jgi:hypothetical protein
MNFGQEMSPVDTFEVHGQMLNYAGIADELALASK